MAESEPGSEIARSERAPWGPDVPVQLRVEVTGKVGSGHFVARPRHRTFWQWLTRQPKPYAIAAR